MHGIAEDVIEEMAKKGKCPPGEKMVNGECRDMGHGENKTAASGGMVGKKKMTKSGYGKMKKSGHDYGKTEEGY